MNIQTIPVYPPIPVREFDWFSWDANSACQCKPLYGQGATEEEAVIDLVFRLLYRANISVSEMMAEVPCAVVQQLV